VLIDSDGADVSVPEDKIERGLLEILALIVSEKISIRTCEDFTGLMCWMSEMFPRIRRFLRSSYAFPNQSSAVARQKQLSEHAASFHKPSELSQDLLVIRSFLIQQISSQACSCDQLQTVKLLSVL